MVANRNITKEVRLNFIPNVSKDVYKFSKDEVANAEKEWSATLIGALIGSTISPNAIIDFMRSNWLVELPKLFLKDKMALWY